MSFADLKKQSRAGSLTEKLIKKVEKLNSGEGGGADERFWKPEVDKAGNGYAVIRFLPAPEGCELPWAQVWSHAFQGPGGWYIENSLTTLGQKDPVSEHNRVLWNSGSDRDKEIARKQKRKLSYYANIYVVSDPAHPENEGRVFLYKFGKKIYDKITEAMQPQFADEEAINPFDFWTGANFKLKIRKVEGYWNYDKSEFDRPNALLDDDDKLERIYKNLNDLNEFSAAS
ncbi:MAG: single-stranded DNA-binding protein, partial [Candidatus Nanopelagicaceae bacterium]